MLCARLGTGFSGPRNHYLRLAFLVLSTAGLVALALVVALPRNRAFSCRTFWDCVSGRPRYQHDLSRVHAVKKFEEEGTLADGSLYFRRELDDAKPEILFLILVKDDKLWAAADEENGGEEDKKKKKQSTTTRTTTTTKPKTTGRSVVDFIDLLVLTGLDFTQVSLGLMTTSKDEFFAAQQLTERLPFARTTVFHQDAAASDGAGDLKSRRAAIAGLRNYLMLRSLQDEAHLIWVDADVGVLSRNLIQRVIEASEQVKGAAIITARCDDDVSSGGGGNQTDTDTTTTIAGTNATSPLNGWALDETEAQLLGAVGDSGPEREEAARRLAETATGAAALGGTSTGGDDGDLVPVDSAGGGLLYLPAGAVHRGVAFPAYNAVGTTWASDGWAGQDVQGICYVARRQLPDAGCFVIGGGDNYARRVEL